MRSWTETARVEHHWVLTNTEREAVLAALAAAMDDPEVTSPTELVVLEGVVAAANAVVSGPT